MSTLPLLRFASLQRFAGLIHGISTRHGGVSSGPFASLNLGWTVGDDRQNVEANTRRLAHELGVARGHLTTTWQVHGNHVVRAELEDRGTLIAKADGIITDRPNLPLIQRYADCTPLLVYDPRRHAVGIAHAGWRGTLANMAGNLVRAMVSQFGSQPEDLVAVVGPAIGPCCYEVGPEVVAAVRRTFPQANRVLVRPGNGSDPAGEREAKRLSQKSALSPRPRGPARPEDGAWSIFGIGSNPRPRLRFDLWEANRWQLAQAGVGQIEVAGICTRCHRDLFFSHRGDHGRTGRFAGVVMLRG